MPGVLVYFTGRISQLNEVGTGAGTQDPTQPECAVRSKIQFRVDRILMLDHNESSCEILWMAILRTDSHIFLSYLGSVLCSEELMRGDMVVYTAMIARKKLKRRKLHFDFSIRSETWVSAELEKEAGAAEKLLSLGRKQSLKTCSKEKDHLFVI